MSKASHFVHGVDCVLICEIEGYVDKQFTFRFS